MLPKPQPKSAPSPAVQIFGLGFIDALMYIGTHSQAPISQKVHDALGDVRSAVKLSISSTQHVCKRAGMLFEKNQAKNDTTPAGTRVLSGSRYCV